MKMKVLICATLCFLGCAVTENNPNLESVRMQNAINNKVHRNKPLPVLSDDKNKLIVEIVDFGSNFPIDARGTDQRVFVRFKEQRVTLFLIISNIYTEDDVRSALTDKLAPPVIVKKFTTIN